MSVWNPLYAYTCAVFTCRCKQWVVNSRTANLDGKTSAELYKNYALCAEHFEPQMFMNAAQCNKLVHDAIPTIFSVRQSLIKRPSVRKRPAQRTEVSTIKKPKHSAQQSVDDHKSVTTLSFRGFFLISICSLFETNLRWTNLHYVCINKLNFILTLKWCCLC